MAFRSGFVSIIGRPNAGKSTLLNALLEFVDLLVGKPQFLEKLTEQETMPLQLMFEFAGANRNVMVGPPGLEPGLQV